MRVKPYIIVRTFKQLRTVSSTARSLSISRMSVYRWLAKARDVRGEYSERNLILLSTRPKNIIRKLNTQEKSAIISLREETGFAAVKIKGELSLAASVNTIHRLLKKEALLNSYGNHRRPRYQKTTHMHLKNTFTIGKLQMDVKYITPELSGLPYTCFEYAVIDISDTKKQLFSITLIKMEQSLP
jgi:hypothetical protein